MDSDLMSVIMGLVGDIAGSVIRVLGSKWIANSNAKRQEREKEQSYVRDQLGAYTSLWRFLKELNIVAANHPNFKKIKDCTHVFRSPDDYEWLRNHFISTKCLLSEETHSRYLEALSKDRLRITTMADPTSQLIPTNYMALQDEAKKMCDRLEEQLG